MKWLIAFDLDGTLADTINDEWSYKLSGGYSMKVATRAKAGAFNMVLKRLTFRQPCPIQIEMFVAAKPEASELRLSDRDLRSFGIILDLQDPEGPGGRRAMPHIKYLNAYKGELKQRWQYKSALERSTQIGGTGETKSHPHFADSGWSDIPGGGQRLCYNELPTKLNWHYVKLNVDLRSMRITGLQCNDRRMNVDDVGTMMMPAWPNLWCMLNICLFCESDSDKRLTLRRERKRQGSAGILISHKLNEVIEISDRITVLRGGKHVVTRETAGATARELARLMTGEELDNTVQHRDSAGHRNDLSLDAVQVVCRPQAQHHQKDQRGADFIAGDRPEFLQFAAQAFALREKFPANALIVDVDPQSLLLTGLTRDGVYVVRGGEIVGAAGNFRFNESPVSLLGRIRDAGDTTACLPREWADWFNRAQVCPVTVDSFNLSTRSEAI